MINSSNSNKLSKAETLSKIMEQNKKSREAFNAIENEWSDTCFDPDSDLWNEEYTFPKGQPCHACFGTGMDKYEDADCMKCYGDGVI